MSNLSRLRQAEFAALASTALAFALTALLAGTGYAVESNPVASLLLSKLGWIGAGLLAIAVEGVLLAGWARVHHRYPRGATAAVGSVAVVGIADVLRNLWILSQVGLPESVHPRFGVATVAVTVGAAVVYVRPSPRDVVAAIGTAMTPRRRSAARAVAFSTLLILSSLGGFVPFEQASSPVVNASAAPGDEIYTTTTGMTNRFVEDPTVVDGVVYAHDLDDGVVAYNKSDGTKLWEVTGEPTSKAPLVVDGVYYGGDENGPYALNASDGSTIWDKGYLTSNQGIRGSPVYNDSVLYVKAVDSTNTVNTTVLAINPGNGSVIWKKTGLGFAQDELVYAAGSIFVANDSGSVTSINAETGAVEWSNNIGARLDQGLSYKNGYIYVPDTSNNNLIRVDTDTGSVDWTFGTDNNLTPHPIVDGDVVYISDNTNTFAVNLADGSEAWSTATGDMDELSLVGDTLFAVGPNDLHALDTTSSGSISWTYTHGSNNADGVVVSDGVAYISTGAGLTAVETSFGDGTDSEDHPSLRANGGHTDAYASQFSAPGSPDVSGTVVDQSGAAVPNATVKVVSYDTADFSGTQSEIQNQIDRVKKQISNPTPPEWEPNRDLTGTDSVTDVDGTYAIAHTAEDWTLNGFQLGGSPTVIPDPKLGQPSVTVPADEPIVVSLWDATSQSFIEDTADTDLPGETTSGTVVVERLDAGGGTVSKTVRETQPFVQITSATNAGTKTHEAVSFSGGLSPGFYQIYPEGQPDRAYTMAVAPDANVNKLKNTIIEGLEDRQGSLTERAQNLQDYIANNKVTVKNTTTNETGYYSFSFSSSTVTEATVVAYKKPDAMSTSTPSRGEIVDYYERQLTESVETAEGVLTCESGIADLGSFYTPGGQAQVDIPSGEADLDVVKVGVPDDLPIDQRACLEQDLLSQLRNSSLADYAPFIRQNLDDLTREELDRLLTQLQSGALTNERLCRDVLSDLGVSATSECGATQGELDDGWIGPPGEGIPVENIDQISRETVERIVRGGTPNLGGGGGGGSPTVNPGDLENTISGTFPFPGVDLVDESVVTVRAHLSNGTTQVYNLSSEYVSIDRRTVRPDAVRVENLPIGDVGGAELAVDVVTPDATAGRSEPITNPDFTGSLPALQAVSVSAAQPGPNERIEVGVDGEAGGTFGQLLNVSVSDPTGQQINTTNVTDGSAAFTTNGSGRYKIRLTMTNPGGQEFVEVVGLVAGEQSRARPPTLRGRTGPIGTFAVVSDGLESGDIDTAAAETQLRLAAIVPADADVPPSIHLHTQAIDTASDYTTTARVLRAPDEQAVNKRTTLIHHGASVPSDAIIYRQQTQPLARNDTNEFGRTRYQGNQSVVESYTDAGGSLSVRRITDPGFVDEAFYQVRLRAPSWVPVSTVPAVPPVPSLPDLGELSGIGVLLLDLGGVLLLGLGRRYGLPSRRTVGVLLVAGALVTAPVVPLQAGTSVDLAPTDDGLLRAAEDLPDGVQRYGTSGVPGWVVKVDTSGSTNATDALQDWVNASDDRALIDAPNAAGYAVVSAPRGAVGATFLTRTLNDGLAYSGYVESVEPEISMSVPDPDPLASNATWSPTLTQQITEWTTRGDNFGVEGVAWREDVNESTMLDARQATRSDTLATSANGTGVTVAVLDTGINTQSGQVFGNGSAGSDLRIDNASKNVLTGESVNATTGDYSAVADGNGHGTWVASAIASAADDPYRGYAPDANLLVLKVLGDDGSGSTHSIAEAVRYAAEQDADVISMSLGAPTYNSELAEAVRNATEQGSTVVIAAGNSRQTTRWVGSPADTPAEGALTVGAASVNTTNTTDVGSTLPAHFSQIGPDPGTTDLSSGVTSGEGVDLVAPGMKVSAATPTTSGTRTNTTLSGTSMATPMVAGAIAQVLDERPAWRDSPARVAGYARNTTRVMPNGSVSAVGNGYLATDQLLSAEEHAETQGEARTDAARARDAGWRTLSNASGGLVARVLTQASVAPAAMAAQGVA